MGQQTEECEKLSEAEERAIRLHRRYLEEMQGRSVSFEEALSNWKAHYAMAWRQMRQQRYLASQSEEILRHKWIESEKAQRDLGRDAVMDWISKYAAAWREAFERQDDDKDYHSVTSPCGGNTSSPAA